MSDFVLAKTGMLIVPWHLVNEGRIMRNLIRKSVSFYFLLSKTSTIVSDSTMKGLTMEVLAAKEGGL